MFRQSLDVQVTMNDRMLTANNQTKKAVDSSRVKLVGDIIYPNVDETKFADLYSRIGSRPNLEIRRYVSTFVLKRMYGFAPSGIPLSDLNRKLEQYIEERAESTSAVSVMVFNATDELASSVYGKINETVDIQADNNSVYEWGSISKMLIWVSVMQLWEQGKIDLNADKPICQKIFNQCNI